MKQRDYVRSNSMCYYSVQRKANKKKEGFQIYVGENIFAPLNNLM